MKKLATLFLLSVFATSLVIAPTAFAMSEDDEMSDDYSYENFNDEEFDSEDSPYDFDWDEDQWDDYDYDDEDWDDEDFEDYNFDEERSKILAELGEEISYLEDSGFQSTIKSASANLAEITDEDEFFNTLDSIYEKLDAHYEEHGDTGYWEDFDEDDYSDFEIPEESQEDFNAALAEVERIETEIDALFQQLDELYALLDSFLGYDDENEDTFDEDDEDFDTEYEEM